MLAEIFGDLVPWLTLARQILVSVVSQMTLAGSGVNPSVIAADATPTGSAIQVIPPLGDYMLRQ